MLDLNAVPGFLPTNLEGMAFGPDLPDGRRLLVLVADNNGIALLPSQFAAFAVPASPPSRGRTVAAVEWRSSPEGEDSPPGHSQSTSAETFAAYTDGAAGGRRRLNEHLSFSDILEQNP